MSQNTPLKQCPIHHTPINVITALPQSLDHLPKKCQLVCPLCYLHHINTHHVCIPEKDIMEKNSSIYLNRSSQEFYKQWTEGLIAILKHIEQQQPTKNNTSKLMKLFTIPQGLTNLLPSNIIELINIVLATQIKLLTGNLQYVLYFDYHHLNNAIFVNNLYNIVLGKPEYSIKKLLQNFKVILNDHYPIKKINTNTNNEQIDKIQFHPKFIRKLGQFKQNLLRKYGKNILIDYNTLLNQQKQSKDNPQINNQSTPFSSRNHHSKQNINTTYKDIVFCPNDHHQSMKKKKNYKYNDRSLQNIAQQLNKNQQYQNDLPQLKQHFVTVPQTYRNNEPQENMAFSIKKNKQNTHRYTKQSNSQLQTPRKYPDFNHNLSQQLSPTINMHHHHNHENTEKKSTPHQKYNFKISLNRTIQNDDKQTNKITNSERNHHLNTNSMQQLALQANSIQIESKTNANMVTPQYFGNIINKMSQQTNNLQQLKDGISHEVDNIDKTIQWMYTNQTPTQRSISTANNTNELTTLKQKYYLLEKQYKQTLYQVEQYKNQLSTKEKQIINQNKDKINDQKQDSQSNYSQNKALSNHSDNSSNNNDIKTIPQDINSYIKSIQLQQHQKTINLSLFNQQLIQKISSLQTQLAIQKQTLSLHCKTTLKLHQQWSQKQQLYLSQISQLNKNNQQFTNILSNKNTIIEELKKNQLHTLNNYKNIINQQYELKKSNELEQMKKNMKYKQEQLIQYINKISNDIQSLIKQNIELTHIVHKSKQQLQQKNTRLSKLKIQLNQLSQQNQQILSKYSRLLQKQLKLQQLFSQFHQNKQAITELQQKIIPLMQQKHPIPKKYIDEKSQSQHSEDQLMSQLNNSEIISLIDKLKRLLNAKIIFFQQYSFKLQQLQQTGKQTKQSLKKLINDNQTIQKYIQYLTNEYEKYQQLFHTKCHENKQQQSKIEQLLKQLTNLNDSNKNIRKTMEKMYEEMLEKLNKEILQVKKNKDIEKQYYEKQKKQKQEKYNLLVVDLSKFNNKIEDMEQQLQLKNKQLQQSTLIHTKTQQQLYNLHQINLQLSTKLQQHQHEFNQQLMTNLIETESKLKSKELEMNDILTVAMEMVQHLVEDKKNQYQNFVSLWKNKGKSWGK